MSDPSPSTPTTAVIRLHRRAPTPALRLRVGDLVRVKPLSEILSTLDDAGCLEGMPFMAEMASYSGRELRVSKRAHKTCDTIHGIGALEIATAVHLEDARCSGSQHGGCQAACLLFWKEAWLARVDAPSPDTGAAPPVPDPSVLPAAWALQPGVAEDAPRRYRCQATEALAFARRIAWWQPRQYVLDLWSGNVGLRTLLAGLYQAAYRNLIAAGVGYRLVVAVHNRLQALVGGPGHLYVSGSLDKTPVAQLDLQPGEWVLIKPFDEIIRTLDRHNKNRGLWFVPQEMGRFCGQSARVVRRIDRIIHERTGEMVTMKTPSVVLEGIVCGGLTAASRMFCPRASTLYWREIWLERVPVPARATVPPGRP